MSKYELVLALAGRSGTGKSTLAKGLAESRGFAIFEGSTIIKTHAEAHGVVLHERPDFEAHHRRMKEELGAACLTEAMFSSSERRLGYAGLRTIANYENIRARGGIVIGLVCNPEICVGRSDKTDPKNAKTLQEYLESCRSIENSTDENGSQVDWVVSNADYVIDTSRSYPQVLALAEAIVDAHIAQ